MNILKRIMSWVNNFLDQRQRNHAAHKAREAERVVIEMLQVMEFEGRLYLCYDNVPILRIENLKKDVIEILKESREDILLWKSKFK